MTRFGMNLLVAVRMFAGGIASAGPLTFYLRGLRNSACHLVIFSILLLIPATSRASGLPITDDFTSDSTIQPTVWQSFAANGGSIILGPTSAGVLLSLFVPGGTADHSAGVPNNSTHIMQKIDNVDFDVETQFTSMVCQPFQGQGLIVQQDDTNFIRFGIYTTGCQAYIYGASGSSLTLGAHV
jgi:hypothetical protein